MINSEICKSWIFPWPHYLP